MSEYLATQQKCFPLSLDDVTKYRCVRDNFHRLGNKKQRRVKNLRTRSLLLSLEEGDQGGVGDLDDLETDTGNISDGVTGTTESSNEHLVVFLQI